MSASNQHVPGTMFTFTPPWITPMFTVTRPTMSFAPGPCASSMAAAAPAMASATSTGSEGESVVRSSRSRISRAAIFVALGDRCV